MKLKFPKKKSENLLAFKLVKKISRPNYIITNNKLNNMLSSSQQDTILYENSKQLQEEDGHPILKKDWSFVFDTANGNYANNNIITFDSTSFASSGKWISYRDGFITLPLVITATGSLPVVAGQAAGVSAAHCVEAADLMLGLKNSTLNLIHQFQVEINGVVVATNYNYANSLLIFKQHCRKSMENVRLNSAFDGYWPDSDSWQFSTTATGSGIGITNNRNLPAQGYVPLENRNDFNEGLRRRQDRFGRATAAGGRSAVYPVMAGNPSAIDRVVDDAANNTKVYYLTAHIRLKDISPLFENMPIVKNTNIRIQLTLNTNLSFVISRTISKTGANITSSALTQSLFQNPVSQTNPINFASAHYSFARKGVRLITTTNAALAGNVAALTVATALNDEDNSYTLNIEANETVPQGSVICGQLPGGGNGDVGQVDYTVRLALCKIIIGNTTYAHQLTSTRLYLPTLLLNPSHEQLYIANNVIRNIEYEDVSFTSFYLDNDRDGSFLLSSGLPRLKALVIIPYFYDDAVSNVQGLHSISSAFASEPSTTSPGTLVTNLQVYLGVTPQFQQPISYSFEQFKYAADGLHGLNSNSDDLSVGIIDMNKFSSNYNYICIPLDRRMDSEENLSNSVSVQLKNLSQRKVQYFCYLIRRKSLQLNILTGERRD